MKYQSRGADQWDQPGTAATSLAEAATNTGVERMRVRLTFEARKTRRVMRPLRGEEQKSSSCSHAFLAPAVSRADG